ncbi:MAG: serine hydrolase [Planctomycetota bacterium]
MAHPPGTHWSYSSGTTNVICRALRQVLGDAAYYRLPHDALFEPLGMRSALIELDSAGHFVGSSLGWATPRDWARFGLLWVQDGVWDGQRILPEGWVQWCTQAAEHSNGRYGGHLWLKLEDDGSGAELPPDTIHAAGHDRQLVTMIPSEELVVVRLGLTRNRVSWDQEQFVADLLEVLRRP